MMSSLGSSEKEVIQHIVHDPIQPPRLLAHPIGFDPLIKVFFLHEELAFHAMMRQGMRPIYQTIPKPADGTA